LQYLSNGSLQYYVNSRIIYYFGDSLPVMH
jgi:hypothetical protein